MSMKYWTLSYRELQFEGKGDPAGFAEKTYVQTFTAGKCEELAKKYNIKLVDPNDDYASGFVIEEHIWQKPEEVLEETELGNKVKELDKKAKEDEETQQAIRDAWSGMFPFFK